MTGRSLRIAFSVGLLLPLLACAGTNDRRGPQGSASQGFLPAPQSMRSGETGEPAFLSVAPGIVWYSYTRMILAPVTLWASPYAGLESMPPADRMALANAAYGDLHHVAGQLCEMVDQPGPNTLIVNAALLDAAVPDPTLVTISATTPQAGLSDIKAPDTFDPGAGAFVGRAVLQIVARDAMTGNVLWQAVDRRPADAAATRPYTSWRDVDYALRSTAAKFGNWLVLLGACT